MKSCLSIIFAALFASSVAAQINCNIYKWSGDSVCFQACQVFAFANRTPQGSKVSQVLYDSVIALCPSFDMAYMEKAVPYLKRGDWIQWRRWIDQAVALNPKDHLGYRGWCRYQFLRDFQGALDDFEMLEKIKPSDIGYSVNGDYHLNIAKALCYKGLGQQQRAIHILEAQLAIPGYEPGFYDLIHLAVLKLETGKPEQAIPLLERQLQLSAEFAETHYYLALAYSRLQDRASMRTQLLKAQELYLTGRYRHDPYDNPMDRIYKENIDRALAEW